MANIVVSLHPVIEGTKYLGSQWTFYETDTQTQIQVMKVTQAERVLTALGYESNKVDEILTKVERKTGFILDSTLSLMEIINGPS